MNTYTSSPVGWTTQSILNFQNERTLDAPLSQKEWNKLHNVNAIKFTCYIPGVNLIVGIAAVAFALYHVLNAQDVEELAVCQMLRDRGFCTIFLGPLLFVVDAIATICHEVMIRNEVRKNGQLYSGSHSEGYQTYNPEDVDYSKLPGL